MGPLALENAQVGYNGQAILGPLTLTIQPGERVALVGRSGAGKSTLLGIMYQQWRRDAALVPQDLGLVQMLSVFHNVYMGRLAAKSTWYNLANLVRPFQPEVDAIRAVLARLSIDDKCWTRAGELSGGERQRTAVARALYQRAGLLLADEPVSALDGPQAAAVMEALTHVYGTAVIAMHDVELALAYTGRVIGIKDGAIALDAPSRELTPRDLLPLY